MIIVLVLATSGDVNSEKLVIFVVVDSYFLRFYGTLIGDSWNRLLVINGGIVFSYVVDCQVVDFLISLWVWLSSLECFSNFGVLTCDIGPSSISVVWISIFCSTDTIDSCICLFLFYLLCMLPTCGGRVFVIVLLRFNLIGLIPTFSSSNYFSSVFEILNLLF